MFKKQLTNCVSSDNIIHAIQRQQVAKVVNPAEGGLIFYDSSLSLCSFAQGFFFWTLKSKIIGGEKSSAECKYSH